MSTVDSSFGFSSVTCLHVRRSEARSTVKVLLLYDYPPSPGGLATQGDLLYRGLRELGVDTHAVHLESPLDKEWYYDWFEPDVVLGIGYWGHTPQIVLHPKRFGRAAVPWLVADGYIANYLDVLNALPLILVTSSWVKEVYERDGVSPRNVSGDVSVCVRMCRNAVDSVFRRVSMRPIHTWHRRQ